MYGATMRGRDRRILESKDCNVYDYTFALDVVKIGEAVKVVYLMDGEIRETTLTPWARN